MGKRVVFVLFLGGCFGDIDASGSNVPTCGYYWQYNLPCSLDGPTCINSPCRCGSDGRVACPSDLSVPRDFAMPRDLMSPDDGGGGFD